MSDICSHDISQAPRLSLSKYHAGNPQLQKRPFSGVIVIRQKWCAESIKILHTSPRTSAETTPVSSLSSLNAAPWGSSPSSTPPCTTPAPNHSYLFTTMLCPLSTTSSSSHEEHMHLYPGACDMVITFHRLQKWLNCFTPTMNLWAPIFNHSSTAQLHVGKQYVWLYSPAELIKTNFLFSEFLVFWVERRQTTKSQNTIPAAFARLQEHLLVRPQTPAINSVLIQIQSHSIINMKTEKPWKQGSRFKMSQESPNISCQD